MEDNVKMDLMDWVYLMQVGIHWQAFVNMVYDFGFHKSKGFFYLGEQLHRFLRRPMLHGVASPT